MLRGLSTLLTNLAICLLLLAKPSVAETIERTDLETVFSQRGVQGTFAAYTPSLDRMILINPTRAAKRFIPASTFKIANSLIALEIGVVKDENEIIPYGGKPQPIKIWERDMSMRRAIIVSNVPVYQELARRVGLKRYQKWLAYLGYGNQQVGEAVTNFWLGGPLEISALEQVRFLALLAQQKLPEASVRHQSVVIDILKLESSGGKTLYGKTGWTRAPDPDIGWFVGWINDGEQIHAFALNIDIKNRSDAKLRKTMTIELLKMLGVY